MFNSVCKDWSTTLRRFSLLEGAQQIFFYFLLSLFFPLLSIVQSSVSLITKDCSLHIIKHSPALDNNDSTESILEECIETVDVLICETICPVSVAFSTLPSNKMWYLHLVIKHISSSWWAMLYSLLTTFMYVFAEIKRLYFWIFCIRVGNHL